MSATELFVCVAILYVILFYIRHFFRRLKELPGPIPFPFVGTLPQLALAGSESHVAFHNFSKKYGDVYRLHFGPHEFIILASFEAYKEILTMPQAQGRAMLGFLKDRNGDGTSDTAYGLAISEGEFWATKRTWVVKTLREFGFGISSTMERSSEEEAKKLVAEWESSFGVDGKSNKEFGVLTLKNAFNMYTTKLIWKMIVGRLNEEDEKVLKSYLKKNSKYFEAPLIGLSVLFVFPWLKHIIPKLTAYDKIMDAVHEGKSVGKKYLDEFSASFRPEDPPINFIQAYFKQMQEGNPKDFFEADFQQVLLDLLQGGSDTTSSFLELFFFFLAVHQDVQDKIYKEMIALASKKEKGTLSFDDFNSLVYLRAVILETHRFGVVVPSPPFRKATEDIYYRGYKIPKNSIIQVNVYSIYYNEAFGKDFNYFRPERFLTSPTSSNNGTLELNELQKRIIPFGLGKRVCPGQRLAEVSLFTLINSVVPHFEILSDSKELTLTSFNFGLTVKPTPFKVKLSRRK